jgi:hypothetical protein
VCDPHVAQLQQARNTKRRDLEVLHARHVYPGLHIYGRGGLLALGPGYRGRGRQMGGGKELVFTRKKKSAL